MKTEKEILKKRIRKYKELAKTIKCKECGSRNWSIQTGLCIESYYKNGLHSHITRVPVEHGLFCADCGEEYSEVSEK